LLTVQLRFHLPFAPQNSLLYDQSTPPTPTYSVVVPSFFLFCDFFAKC
jgi:hypothetical protein